MPNPLRAHCFNKLTCGAAEAAKVDLVSPEMAVTDGETETAEECQSVGLFDDGFVLLQICGFS